MSKQLWTYRDQTDQTIDLTGFEVEARDGTIGRVDGATNEVDVSYIVVDAALQRVLLPAGFVTTVDAKKRRLHLSCTMAEVRGAPHFDEQTALAAAPSSRHPEAPDTPDERGEPTRETLYAEARRLGIEGRSKMRKRELAKAIERAQSPWDGKKPSPIEVQALLEGVGYPAGKRELLSQAKKRRARAEIRSTLERLPNRRFEDPTDVSRAIGEL